MIKFIFFTLQRIVEKSFGMNCSRCKHSILLIPGLCLHMRGEECSKHIIPVHFKRRSRA